MICPVKLTNEMSGLSGRLHRSMTRCGHEATERSRSGAAMKLQDVMLRAMAKEITWFQAAEILGITC